MSFTTPTIDVYLPGTTLGIGNVNAGIINIGKTGTEVNIGGSMNVMNLVTSPSCTMTSLTTGNLTAGNLIISPFAGDVSFNNFSAVNATFNTINSSNILIGPYPTDSITSKIINSDYIYVNEINSNNLNINTDTISLSGSNSYPRISINGNYGMSGQVITSGGNNSINWSDAGTTTSSSLYKNGKISNPGLSGSVTFDTSFTYIPYVFLMGEYNSTTTNLVNLGVIGRSLTGFNWLASSTGLTNIQWLATAPTTVIPNYISGTISNPGISGSITFDTAFIGDDPYVFLMGDCGLNSTTIINLGLAGTSLTSFNWLASSSGLTNIYWLATRSTSTSYKSGFISNPGISGSVTFDTGFTSVLPYVFLIGDYGLASTTIINLGLAGTSLTGFNWLASSTGLTNIYWFAVTPSVYYKCGSIANPGILGTVTFDTEFVGDLPYVFLMGDYGLDSTTIVNLGLAKTSLTGFNWLASSTGLTNIYWFATQ